MNFVSNALGKAVTKWEQGREYLVAPATTIVHGVLAGSKGALYYPPEETHKAGPAWNGTPIVLYHPMDELGNNVEVDYPGARERQEIGFTRDTKTNNGVKLQHNFWFDVKKTAAADSRFGTDVLNRLKQGHAPIGTSTGLFTKDVPAKSGANFNGRPYSHVATNHVPNHIAVLPDQVGACSINDGCGVLINGKQGTGPTTRRDESGRRLTLTQNGWVALNQGQAMAPTKDQLADRIARLEILLNAGGNIAKDEAGRFAVGGGKGTVIDPNDVDEADDEEEDEDQPRDALGVPIGKKATKNANPEGINQYSGGGGGSIAGGGGNSVRSSPLPPAAQVSQSAYAASEKAGTAHIAHRANQAAKAGDSKAAAAAHQEAADHHLALATHLSGKEQNEHLRAMGEHHNAMAAHQAPTKNAEQGRHPKEGTYQGMAHTAARQGYTDTRQNPLELDRFSSANGDDAANPIESEDGEIGQGDRPGTSKGKDEPILQNNRQQRQQGTNNMFPPDMNAPDPHAMSKQAAGATLQTEHEGAMAHAQGAIAASKGDKPERATALHQKAAMAHEQAATDARKVNQPMEASDHDNAAALHRKAASMQSATCNQRRQPVAFNRASALQQLTRNCACDKDLVALNSMSDKMLQFMVANEKAEGSNADAIGSGEDDAGSDESVQDGNNKLAKGGKVSGKGPAMNKAAEWLDSMPEEFKPVWNSAVESDKERRMILVERITANVGDPKAKVEMQKQFMNIQKYGLPELRQLASLVPQPRMVQNHVALNPYDTPQPVYLGANGAPVTANQQATDMDDVLDIPTLNFAAERAEDREKQAG